MVLVEPRGQTWQTAAALRGPPRWRCPPARPVGIAAAAPHMTGSVMGWYGFAVRANYILCKL